MSLPSAPRALALPVLVAIALAGCTATPQPEETYVDVPVETEQPAVTPNPVEPDTTLIVRATATADNGAQLALELQVHQSAGWDYAGTQTLPAALVQDCGSLTLEQFAAEQWSFTRGNLTAIPTTASTADWPTTATITVEPSAESATITGRELLGADVAGCAADRNFAGTGRGAVAVGIPQDAASLTAWAALAWGFRTDGATLTDCEVQGTDLGAQFGATAASQADDSACLYAP